MEKLEYVFKVKSESTGDEIIIGEVEFKLDTNKGNTSFGEVEPQGGTSAWVQTSKMHLLEVMFWKVP